MTRSLPLLLSRSLLALAALPLSLTAQTAATPADVTFTSLTTLRPAGEDVSSADGTTGWPGARYPTSPPLYGVRPGATTGTLYGGFLGQGPLPTRHSIYTAVGLYSLGAGVGVYSRLAYVDGSNLFGRISSTPVRTSDGALYAVMTSEYGRPRVLRGTEQVGGDPAYSTLVGQGLLIRTDFDGTYPGAVAATVGQLRTPNGALIVDAQDNLYGVDRGPADNGRIFKLSTRTGTLTTLVEFPAGPGGRRQVVNDIVFGTDGKIYGVSGYVRGLDGHPDTPREQSTPTGTIFRIDPADPASLAVLHTFTLAEGEINVEDNASSDGWLLYPSGKPLPTGEGGNATLTNIGSGQQSGLSSLIDGGDGYLYGATSVGSCNVYATATNTTIALRRLNRDSPLCGFRRWVEGANSVYARPYPYHDAPKPYGQVYRIPKAGGALQILHSFSETDGATPRGPLAIGSDGAIYGTTMGGGPNVSCTSDSDAGTQVGCGTIFRIKRSAIAVDAQGVVTQGGFEQVHAFSGNDGNIPQGLRAGADGRLYGVTSRGGSYKDSAGKVIPTSFGTVFQLAPANAEVPPAAASLVAAPVQIKAGETTTLTWTTENTGNCTATSTGNDWRGAVPAFGSVTLTPPAGTYRYTLTCNVAGTASGAQVSATTTVYVSTPATAEDGNAVQYGNGGGGAIPPLLLAPIALAALALRRRKP